MKFQAKLFTGSSINAVIEGKSYSVGSDHPNWTKIVEAFKVNDADTFVSLTDVVQTIQNFVSTDNRVEIKDETVYYMGEPLHNTLTSRMLHLLREGHSIDSLVKFLEKLMLNPSKRAVDEAYGFLEKENIPITEDGNFLCYKCVQDNYLDKHSGTFDNSPGSVLEMPRNKVCDNKDQTCSYGFHAGSLSYSGPQGDFYSEGNKVIIVSISPTDIVSIPSDYNANKLRCCRYVVVDDYRGPLTKSVYSGSSVNDEDYDEDEYDEDENDEDENVPEVDEFDIGDLVEGDNILFNYRGEVRNFLVDSITWDDDLCTGTLQYPETNAGDWRSFKLSDMERIRLV